jgi:cell wall-associated NlpC family hydrolase
MNKGTRLLFIAGIIAAVLLAAGVLCWRVARRPSASASAQMVAASDALLKAGSDASTRPSAASEPATARGKLVTAALALQGVPYKWAAKGPDHYDCSGFTRTAYARIGVQLPDGSYNQATGEKALRAASQLAPGDLILYRWPGKRAVEHVTMYAGDGWVVGTGTPGEPSEVALYPLSHDLVADGRVLTYRHVRLADER